MIERDAYIDLEIAPLQPIECEHCPDSEQNRATHVVRITAWLDGLGSTTERKVCERCKRRCEEQFGAVRDMTMAEDGHGP